jgi:hypothetical protein
MRPPFQQPGTGMALKEACVFSIRCCTKVHLKVVLVTEGKCKQCLLFGNRSSCVQRLQNIPLFSKAARTLSFQQKLIGKQFKKTIDK